MLENVKTFTDQNWEIEVGNTNGLVIADVWAPWCGPCRIVGPIIDELADNFAGKATIGKLNADENIKSQELGVTGIPAILFLREGKEVDRVVGAVPKQMIKEKIEYHLAAELAT
jgi:thioredoxin 1